MNGGQIDPPPAPPPPKEQLSKSPASLELNVNCVTIYRTKCTDIASLNILATSFFHYNSEEKSLKFPNPKMKLSKIDMSLPVQIL